MDCEKLVLNISSKPLTDTEKFALQKGMNFPIAPKKIPTAEIVAAVEDSITKLLTEVKLTVRAQVSDVFSRACPPPSNIPSKEMKALQDLRMDKSRLIISADKGNCTVVMDCKDYDDKVKELLGDELTYKVLRLPYTFRTLIFFKSGSGFLSQSNGQSVISNLNLKKLKKTKYCC